MLAFIIASSGGLHVLNKKSFRVLPLPLEEHSEEVERVQTPQPSGGGGRGAGEGGATAGGEEGRQLQERAGA